MVTNLCCVAGSSSSATKELPKRVYLLTVHYKETRGLLLTDLVINHDQATRTKPGWHYHLQTSLLCKRQHQAPSDFACISPIIQQVFSGTRVQTRDTGIIVLVAPYPIKPGGRGSRVYRYRNMACLITSSSPVPLKTRRVGQRSTLNLSRAETSSRWWGEKVRRGVGCQLRCRPRHLTMVQNYVVRRQKP
ncbi:uncharacterized protein TNCV_3837311 [Trichonephila clavipes]|nr:uncharacterized protein TNCV_3837311 [Trichonephila clavipes]